MLAGVVFVLFYTWPLKHIGLGEPTVLLVWGPLMVGGTYLCTAGQWSWDAALIGTAYAPGPTGRAVRQAHRQAHRRPRQGHLHLAGAARRVARAPLRHRHVDRADARRGRPGVDRRARLAAPDRARRPADAARHRRRVRPPAPETCPPEFPKSIWPTYLVAYAFRYNRRFGLLFLLGLLIELALS